MTFSEGLPLFYKYHSFDDPDERDDWYIDLDVDDRAALIDCRQLLESDPLIVAMAERGGVVTSIEASVQEGVTA